MRVRIIRKNGVVRVMVRIMVMVKIRVNIMVRIKATERVRVIYKSNSKDNC